MMLQLNIRNKLHFLASMSVHNLHPPAINAFTNISGLGLTASFLLVATACWLGATGRPIAVAPLAAALIPVVWLTCIAARWHKALSTSTNLLPTTSPPTMDEILAENKRIMYMNLEKTCER